MADLATYASGSRFQKSFGSSRSAIMLDPRDLPGRPRNGMLVPASDPASGSGAWLECRPPQAEGQGLVRVLDALAALVLAILTFPILLAGLIWVMVLDPGMPFFLQTRIGVNGKPFRLVKIRSMYRNPEGHPRFCSHGDPRIIRGGRLLRKLRIDELPQFLNIFMGHMALVGPRPEQPVFVETYLKEIPRYGERHQVKPGITGLAQVTLGYVDSVRGAQKKLRYDLLFIKKRSVGLWFMVVLRTIRVIVVGHGAR